MNGINYITQTGLDKIKGELHQLLKVDRPQVVATVAWAASNGDRSENADYIYGKRRLREIDKRIGFLTARIEAAQVVNPKEIQSDKVVFGATVTVEDEDGESKIYQIVGEDEIAAEQGRISWKSPLAKALLGKSEGDEVVVKKPKGDTELVILKIQYL